MSPLSYIYLPSIITKLIEFMRYNITIFFVLLALIASLVESSAISSPFASVPAHVKSIYAASDHNDASGTGDTGTKGEDTGTKGEDTGTKGEDTGTKGEDTGTTRQSPDVN